jgi:hypothetical protein
MIRTSRFTEVQACQECLASDSTSPPSELRQGRWYDTSNNAPSSIQVALQIAALVPPGSGPALTGTVTGRLVRPRHWHWQHKARLALAT